MKKKQKPFDKYNFVISIIKAFFSEIFRKQLPCSRSTTACSPLNALSTYSTFSTILIVRGILKIGVSLK